MKKHPVLTLIVFLSGLMMLGDYYFPKISYFHGIREHFLNWGRVALTFAMLLGILNLLGSNLKKMALRTEGWLYSFILLLSFAVTLYFAVPYHVLIHGSQIAVVKGTDIGTIGYKIFMDVYTPLSATIFALVAFYIVSTAFRAFRAKNVESTLLLASALLVMIGSIPLGDKLFLSLHLNTLLGHHNFSWLSNEIQMIPMTAGQRAILIGTAVGVVSVSIKILTGIDQSYLGGSDYE